MELTLSANDTKVAVQEYLEKRWAITAPESCPQVGSVKAIEQGAVVTCFKISLVPGKKRVVDEPDEPARETEHG